MLKNLINNWRLWSALFLLVLTELVLFGAAEGAQKWAWIEVGTIPNVILAFGYIFPSSLTKKD
jgi:hypothetical protein